MATIDPQSQTFILAAIEASRNEMIARLDAVNDKVDGINARLDTLNGRTAKNTADIASVSSDVSKMKWVGGGAWAVALAVVGAAAKKLFS